MLITIADVLRLQADEVDKQTKQNTRQQRSQERGGRSRGR